MIQPSTKSYGVAVSFSGVFGLLGIQHFYLGRYLLGFLDLGLSIGAFAFIYFGNSTETLVIGLLLLAIDFLHSIYVLVKLLAGEYEDGEGRLVMYPGQKIRPENVI
jgi:hypothetical protein